MIWFGLRVGKNKIIGIVVFVSEFNVFIKVVYFRVLMLFI